MRLVLAAILIAAVPAMTAAQSTRSRGESASLPTIGLPLPTIGLPLPSIGLPDASAGAQPNGRPHTGNPPRRRGSGKGGHTRPSFIYFGPGYAWDFPPTASASDPSDPFSPDPAPAPLPAATSGTLTLDLRPSDNVQLFVDRYFVGTLDDANGLLALEAGPHRIDIRAPGYETITVDVRIEPGRDITYRAAMVRLDAQAGPEPAAPPKESPPLPLGPVYFIPGCYLGNVPPKDAKLPATCDQSRVKVLQP